MPAGNVHVPSSAEGIANDPDNATLWEKVDEFKGKADEFYNVWQTLRAKRQLAARDPQALKEWNDLMGEAEGVTAKVSDVEFAVNQAKSWAGSFFGVDNVRGSLGELGLLPFVIALVAGAIAWLGSWLTKAYMLDSKLDTIENLASQGYSTSEINHVVNQPAEETFLTKLGGNIGTGVAFAGIAGMLLYFFFEKKRGF